MEFLCQKLSGKQLFIYKPLTLYQEQIVLSPFMPCMGGGKSAQRKASCFLTGRYGFGDEAVTASATENYRHALGRGKGEKVE